MGNTRQISSVHRISRTQRWLWWGHTAAFGMMWSLALMGSLATVGNSRIPSEFVIILLMWTLIYGLHTINFQYARGRAESSGDDREAYRDGYQDAMRQIMSVSGQERIDPRRLMLDDDGELTAEYDYAGKRKRG